MRACTLSYMQAQENQVYFTKREAARYLRCSLRTIDNFLSRKQLRAYKLTEKKLLFVREDLDSFAQRQVANSSIDKLVDEVLAELSDAR
jgi:excisionase family DNA binding protein